MKPILFLGGAPKAGTSYLFDLLAQHPNISASQPKETFYFVDADYPLVKAQHYSKQGLKGFVAFFSNTTNTSLYLEGNTHLLYQEECIEAIKRLDAQVLFVLREPARRVLSAFEYTKNRGAILEKDISFATYVNALLAKDTQQINAWVRRGVAYHFLHKELEMSTYMSHIARWQQALGKARVQVIQFEQLIQQPNVITQQLFTQVAIPPHRIRTDVAQHSTYHINNKQLHYYIRQLQTYFPKNQMRNRLRDWYFKLQKRPLQREEDINIPLQALKAYFAPYNTPLAAMTDIDLSLWT